MPIVQLLGLALLVLGAIAVPIGPLLALRTYLLTRRRFPSARAILICNLISVEGIAVFAVGLSTLVAGAGYSFGKGLLVVGVIGFLVSAASAAMSGYFRERDTRPPTGGPAQGVNTVQDKGGEGDERHDQG